MKKKKEELKPIPEQLDKEIDEISKLREESNKKIVPYYEQIQQLALPGPEGKQSKMVSDMNKGFEEDELGIIQKYELPLPSNILIETLKDTTIVKNTLDKSGELALALEKAHLSTTKASKKKY